MREAEEQDTCRICSAPAEPDQPLFYPCKCSGTIRYIHQDCLTTWLAHSKKKHCDVCKHPYSFTKVYAPDMPKRLPPVLLIRRLAQQCLFALLLGIRAIAVAIIWLAVLPWVTVWTWRMYFSVGDSAAWWISDRPRPPPTSPTLPDFLASAFASSATSTTTGNSFFARLTSHPSWVALSSDIFKGQIIATLIVLTFVAVFLLREWISQNARPGVFEEDEVLGERDRPAQGQPPAVAAPAAPDLQPRMPSIDRQADTPQDIDSAHRLRLYNHPVGDHAIDERGQPRRLVRRRPLVPQQNGGNGGSGRMGPEDALQYDLHAPARARRRLGSGERTEGVNIVAIDVSDVERMRKHSFTRRLHVARMSGLERRLNAAQRSSSSETDLGAAASRDFEFTFRSSTRLPRRTLSEHRLHKYHSADARADSPSAPSTHFPPVQLERPSAPIPFELYESSPNHDDNRESSSSPRLENVTLSSSSFISPSLGSDSDWVSSFSSLDRSQRWPPFPGTFLTTSDDHAPPLEITTSSSDISASSLPSTGLATHLPPEDFEAGPSGHSPSVDSESTSSEGDEHSKYFKECSEDRKSVEMTAATESAGDKDIPIIELDFGEDTDDDDDDDEETENDEPDAEDVEDVDVGILEGVDWEQGREVRNNRPARVPPGAGEQAQQNGEEPAQPEANEELEGNAEDDMEGAMEAIGMRGPIYGVIQNAALMIFVLDTAIGLGVWVPFTIGKSTALLSLDPYRFLQLLHFPIRAIRIVTDPIVDSLLFLLVHFVLPFLWGTARGVMDLLISSGQFVIAKAFGQDKASEITSALVLVSSRPQKYLQDPKKIYLKWFNISPPPITPTSSLLKPLWRSMIDRLEPYFSLIGEQVADATTRIQSTWKRMALGQGPGERVFAIILGYTVVGLLLSLYLNILTVGNVRSAGRAVKNAIRQQLLVVKVAAFIFIELITFPLGCGVVLDLCTVRLFPEMHFAARAAYFMRAPLTAAFYHWVAGTMFMYSFAVLLSGCRSIMRPGAMWFIKDPQDQNSHPIRDILERPTFTQLRKIFISGVLYSFVVACVVGSISGLLILSNQSIMPIRWKTRQPLSTVPVDLLFLHQVLPYSIHYFRPKKIIKIVSTQIWKFLAHKLRLSSYFFGGRDEQEEYTPHRWFLPFFTSELDQIDDTVGIRDGGYRRVPNTDHIALPRDMRATVAVNEKGEPLDDEARELMKLQDLETEKAKRSVKDDYTVVYIPPHFKYRVILFIVLFWCVTAISFGLFVGAPLQLGRAIFKLFTPDDVHDGYSFLAGFYTLWACYAVGKSLGMLDKRRQRRVNLGPRAQLFTYAFKRAIVWLVAISYMSLCLGVIIPTLLSLVVDLYVVLPIRLMIDPDMTIHFRIVDAWALGILYANIALHCYQLRPDHRLSASLRKIVRNGWTNPDPLAATKEVIGPAIIGLSGMIWLPAAIFGAVCGLIPGLCVNPKILFIHVYSGVFVLAGFGRLAVVFGRMGSSWSQAIRDQEFLVEKRLRNLETEKENVETHDASLKGTETEYSTDN